MEYKIGYFKKPYSSYNKLLATWDDETREVKVHLKTRLYVVALAQTLSEACEFVDNCNQLNRC